MIKLIKLLFNAEAVNLVIFLIVELTDESSGTKLFFPLVWNALAAASQIKRTKDKELLSELMRLTKSAGKILVTF